MRRSLYHSNLDDIVASLRHGSDSQLQRFIEKKGDVNIRDGYGKTLLMYSICDENLPRIQMLINSGSNVNVVDKEGSSPLIHASRRNRVDIVKLLLESRCDVNVVNEICQTALSVVVNNENIPLVRLLITHGADCNALCNVNMESYKDGTVLIYAVQKKLDVIQNIILTSENFDMCPHLVSCLQNNLQKEFIYFLSLGANCFKNMYSTSHYGKYFRVNTVFERVYDIFTVNCHQFRVPKSKHLKELETIILEYGRATALYKDNDLLKAILTCRKVPSRIVNADLQSDVILSILKCLSNLGLMYENYQTLCHCESNCDYMKILKQKLEQPYVITSLCKGLPSLQSQCRRVIRVALVSGITSKVQHLELPDQLKKFLCFSGELKFVFKHFDN